MSGQSTAAKLAAARRRIAELERAVADVAAAERAAIIQLARDCNAVSTGDEGTQCWFADIIDRYRQDGAMAGERHRGGTREDATP